MESRKSADGGSFTPHPGTIVFRTAWNHSERTEQAARVPEANKFVYFEASGRETSNPVQAAARIPIVEVEMSSFDASGHLVEPAKAVRISISEYGPGHKFLRHSTGPGGA
jgi:hypothetical protein